jgi:hypothetical protein
VTYVRVHLATWASWAGTLVFSLVVSGGRTRLVVADPGDYLAFGIAFVSCMALVASSVAAKLSVGGLRASFGPARAIAAMLGGMLPAAWALAWTPGPKAAPDARRGPSFGREHEK